MVKIYSTDLAVDVVKMYLLFFKFMSIKMLSMDK